MLISLALILALINLPTVFSADILVAVMPQGKSHGGSFVPLLDELVKQGKSIL